MKPTLVKTKKTKKRKLFHAENRERNEIAVIKHKDYSYAAWAKLIERALHMRYVSDTQVDYIKLRWLSVFEGIVGISDNEYPLFYAQIKDEIAGIA